MPLARRGRVRIGNACTDGVGRADRIRHARRQSAGGQAGRGKEYRPLDAHWVTAPDICRELLDGIRLVSVMVREAGAFELFAPGAHRRGRLEAHRPGPARPLFDRTARRDHVLQMRNRSVEGHPEGRPEPTDLGTAMLAAAMLGSCLNRKRDRPPVMKTVWTGCMRLASANQACVRPIGPNRPRFVQNAALGKICIQ